MFRRRKPNQFDSMIDEVAFRHGRIAAAKYVNALLDEAPVDREGRPGLVRVREGSDRQDVPEGWRPLDFGMDMGAFGVVYADPVLARVIEGDIRRLMRDAQKDARAAKRRTRRTD